MTPPEDITHSFIIRIWPEQIDAADRSCKWRGHITHVPSGQRRYFEQLDILPDFIEQFLQANNSLTEKS